MKKLRSQEIINVVDALIGATTAVGESNEDERIMKNLKAAIDLTNWMLEGIADSARTRHRVEGSMHDIGQTAFTAMCEWKEWLEDITNLE